jgi:hypothetical protein
MTKRWREIEKLLTVIAEQADANLLELKPTRGGHVRARFDRGGPVFVAATPSDWRAIRNIEALARRALRS